MKILVCILEAANRVHNFLTTTALLLIKNEKFNFLKNSLEWKAVFEITVKDYYTLEHFSLQTS